MYKGQQKFFICKHCGNIVGIVNNAGVPLVCCGEPMEELIPNTVDAAVEKHLPVVSSKEGLLTVSIGSVAHPMTEEHYIQWVYVETERGGQRKCLVPGEEPKLRFSIIDDKAIAVYAYCNLHGLWKTELK